MKTGEFTCDGLVSSSHVCDACGVEFTVTPAILDDEDGWNCCLADDCQSYNPERDLDILFMSDGEIAREKHVVSIAMLKKRQAGQGTAR